MKKILGSGGGNSKLVHPGIRTGSPSRGSSPGSADQLGQSTAFKKDKIDAGPAYNAGGKYGNELALNVGKGGPGTGRTVQPCGSEGTFGPVNPGNSAPARDILSAFGPDKRKG